MCVVGTVRILPGLIAGCGNGTRRTSLSWEGAQAMLGTPQITLGRGPTPCRPLLLVSAGFSLQRRDERF